MSLTTLIGSFSPDRTILTLCAVGALALFDLRRRVQHQPTHLLFAAVLGTFLSVGLVKTVSLLIVPDAAASPFTVALGLLLLVLGWKFLFGPWEPQTKAAMLGVFLFWITLKLIVDESPDDRSVRLIAAAVALLPAIVWCWLFLKYHTERISTVLLLFFSGMLATTPILVYDTLVRRGIEVQFFLFSVRFESFSMSSQALVAESVPERGLLFALAASFVSYIIVALIEEGSKYWVLMRSGRSIFTSIDDVMQLSIIVAIGFAFAENIINPVYFTSFVREFIFSNDSPDVSGFLSNVLGRSVLTSMVHIVSTGVLGYFLGLALFANSYATERRQRGGSFVVARALHNILRLRTVSVFRVQMVVTGFLAAVLLHGFFNFIVTIPDLIPSHPESVGAFIGNDSIILTNIPLLLLPALLYVFGGFWLVTSLFLCKENMEERGHLLRKDSTPDDPSGEIA